MVRTLNPSHPKAFTPPGTPRAAPKARDCSELRSFKTTQESVRRSKGILQEKEKDDETTEKFPEFLVAKKKQQDKLKTHLGAVDYMDLMIWRSQIKAKDLPPKMRLKALNGSFDTEWPKYASLVNFIL